MNFSNILKNSFFYSLASALQGMVSFFLLPLYTRFLSPEDYAILALVASFTGILAAVVSLQIHSGIPRFVIKFLKDKERARAYFTGVFILLAAILFISCLLLEVFGAGIIRVIFSSKDNIAYSPFFRIAAWTLLPALLVSAGLSLVQTLEWGGKFFLLTIAQVTVNILAGVLLVVFLKQGAAGVLWAQLISSLFALVTVVWLIRDWFGRSFLRIPVKDIKDSIKYSLPIIPHMLSIYIYMYSDRLILQRYVSLADIGIYSIATTLASILLIIVNSVNNAYCPYFFKIAETDRQKAGEELKRFIGVWWAGIMVIFMGYLLFSSYLVRFMTRPSFYPAIPFIPILAGAFIFRGLYCFCANNLFYMEKTKFIPVITVAAALASIALNLIFIPKFGIMAASWNTVLSYFVTFVLAHYFSARYFPVKYPWRDMLNIAFLLFFIYLAAKLINMFFPGRFILNFSVNIVAIMVFGTAAAATFIKIKQAVAVKNFITSMLNAVR